MIDVRQRLESPAGASGTYYSLPLLEQGGVGNISRLPVSLRILLESVLRNLDGRRIRDQDVEELARWHRTPRGLIASSPGRVFWAEFDGLPPDRMAPVTQAEAEAGLQRVSGTDIKILSMTTATRWSDNARQATTYRMGRVFLAGAFGRAR